MPGFLLFIHNRRRGQQLCMKPENAKNKDYIMPS